MKHILTTIAVGVWIIPDPELQAAIQTIKTVLYNSFQLADDDIYFGIQLPKWYQQASTRSRQGISIVPGEYTVFATQQWKHYKLSKTNNQTVRDSNAKVSVEIWAELFLTMLQNAAWIQWKKTLDTEYKNIRIEE
jgi:hypothetical protein